MRPGWFDKARSLAVGRMVRTSLVGLSVTAMAVGGGISMAAGQSSATPLDEPNPLSSLTRDESTSRDVTRAAMTPEQLAAARTEQLAASAADLAAVQQQEALDSRQQDLSTAAQGIASQSTYLRNRGVFVRPTAGKLGSHFGPRFHPILHYWRMHDGMDIGGSCGQPIVAASEGVVVKAATGGYNGGSGNNVRIDDGLINGVKVETAYLHMQTIVVKVGQQVQKGDLLGTVGSTGLSTACHLHFSVYEDGKGVDPAKYLKL